jgi:hypothetical protein
MGLCFAAFPERNARGAKGFDERLPQAIQTGWSLEAYGRMYRVVGTMFVLAGIVAAASDLSR